MFNSLSDRITVSIKQLRGRGQLSEADIDATVSEIRRALLDADVALPVVREFAAQVREKAKSATVSQALKPGEQVVKIVHQELVEILGGQTRDLRFAKRPPTVIMLAGLQGSGKTTLAGKLGHWLRQQGHTPLLVAADLQRPNAVTQLQVVGDRAGVPVWAPEPGNGVGDPIDVARSGVQHAREKLYSVVVVDTAGRLGVDTELMQQAADIREAVDPDEVLFVLDAMIGQDAVATANAFLEGVDFTGVVLTKLDGDARGGAALSVRGVTGRPVMFASTGEKVDDFERFHADRMASRILDMGDLLTLIEQAERAYDDEDVEDLQSKMQGGTFTLDDFLAQLQQVRRMGSMKKLLGMMPGMAQMREQLDNFDEREIDRVEAIVRSMTPAERRNPKILNGSRRQRIARGSGTEVRDVNSLVERFEQARVMMQRMASGGGGAGGGANPMAGMMPGMGGMPGMGKKSKGRMQAPPPKKKGKSGNPAKRLQQEKQMAAEALRRQQEDQEKKKSAAGSSFGLGSMGKKDRIDASNMPDISDLEKYLK